MTNNQLTETELFLRDIQLGYMLSRSDIELIKAMAAELQDRRKAESEPVAWTDEEELRDVNVAGIGYLFGIDREANKFADPRRQIMLYRHAQPAPVVQENSDPRDAFEAAFPMPNHAQRCGDGYVVTSYGAWTAYEFVKKWEGWNAFRAAMLNGGKS